MAFLDNSGDIILDAVLTDTGRMRLAKGDGTFRIAKFALGDDEINYGSYDKNHASGSAYFDLEILQTPVLEALTNNTSTMQTKLISIPRTNLLYLPILKLEDGTATSLGLGANSTESAHVVLVDKATEDKVGSGLAGVLFGENPRAGNGEHIRVDQGLDTTEIPITFTIDSDLYETQFIVEIDNRFGSIVKTNGDATRVSFVDDDNIASYYFSQGTDTAMISSIGTGEGTNSVIQGPRGSRFDFKIKASLELNTSTFLFTQLGSTKTGLAGSTNSDAASSTFRFIDTTVRVMGATTGYRLDIPVRFAKLQ
tara:strand:- start:656 stop:1585 length:930 start_codon:yes stop_codon:yes gene_type:complete